MNVAYFAENLRIDGTVRFVLRQARWLHRNGHGVWVFTGGHGDLSAAFARASIPIEVFPAVAGDLHHGDAAEQQRRLAQLVRDRAIDAVVATAPAGFPFAQSAVGEQVRVFYNVLSADCFPDNDAAELVRRAAVEGRIIGHIYDDVAEQAERFGFSPSDPRLAYLPLDEELAANGDDLAAFRAQCTSNGAETVILTACRLDDEHYRYVLPLARGVERLRSRGHALRLIVVGNGIHFDDLRTAAPAGTTFLGMVSELPRLYSAADIYCGEGSSMLEAARAGCPVIVTCAQTVPGSEHLAFAIMGMHTANQVSWLATPFAAQVPFDAAIGLLLEQPRVRKRTARLAASVVRRLHGLDTYMLWLQRVLAGQNPASLIERDAGAAAEVLSIRDGKPGELAWLGRMLDRYPRAAARSSTDVAWADFAALSDADWHRITLASRRTATSDATVIAPAA